MFDTSEFISIGLALLALTAMVFIGVRGSGRQSEEDYLIGGRDVGSGPLAGTIAAGIIGGGVLLVFFEYVFNYGISALWIIGGLVAGLVLLNFVAVRYKPLADKNQFYTLPDLYRYHWGDRAGILSTITISIWTIGFIILQLISAGVILEQMTTWPYAIGVLVAAGTVGSYLVVSGYRAVIATDVAQYIALVLVLLLVAFFAFPEIGYSKALEITFSNHLDVGIAAGFFILGMLNIVVSADLWQRIYSARSSGVAKRALFLSAGLIVLVACLLLVPPLYAKSFLPDAVPNQAAVESFTLLLPPALLGLGLVGLLSTVVATLDTMVFVLAISVAHDIQVRVRRRPVDRRRPYMRIAMVVILVAGAIVAVFYRDLLATGLALSSIGLILAPSILLQLTPWKPSSLAVELGMVAGLLTAVGLWALGGLTPETALLTGVSATIITLAGYLVTPWVRRR